MLGREKNGPSLYRSSGHVGIRMGTNWDIRWDKTYMSMAFTGQMGYIGARADSILVSARVQSRPSQQQERQKGSHGGFRG
jgi:hypothetical protein